MVATDPRYACAPLAVTGLGLGDHVQKERIGERDRPWKVDRAWFATAVQFGAGHRFGIAVRAEDLGRISIEIYRDRAPDSGSAAGLGERVARRDRLAGHFEFDPRERDGPI